MAIIDVIMPKLGESITEGTVIKWYKKPGERVKKDETLLEISTDKVDSEIPAPADGVLLAVAVEVNKTVAVGTVIATIDAEGVTAGDPPLAGRASPEARISASGATGAASSASGLPRGAATQPVKLVATPAVPARPAVSAPKPVAAVIENRAASPFDPAAAPTPRGPAKEGRYYSPLVMSIAQKEGLSLDELSRVTGSGAGGRVTKNDIINYAQARSVAVGSKEATLEDMTYGGNPDEIVRVTMDAIRQKTAAHMRLSLDTSAHVYCVSECDVTEIMRLIKDESAAFEREAGSKLTFTPFVAEAVTKALLEFPGVNASVSGNSIIQKKFVNLGVAVSTQRGLIVPVVKNAHKLGFKQLAAAVNDLIERARNKKLTPEDVVDSTFTVTNFGVFGVLTGLPIINQPNTAILGVGAVKKRPVVEEGPHGDSIIVRSMLYLSLSFDHRVIDGDLGSKFLQAVVGHLQAPRRII